MGKDLIHYKERSIKDLTPLQRFDPFTLMTPLTILYLQSTSNLF